MNSQGQLLIVDDEPQVVQFLAHLLQQHSYATDTALSAKEALSVLSQKAIDVIITDIRMPGMDGIDLIGEALKLQPDLQCIVATGHGDMETALRAMEFGVTNYFQKPLNFSEIRIAVENVLEKIRLKRKIRQKKEQIQKLNSQLQEANEKLKQRVNDALKKVKLLSGLLPTCANCRRIRDDKGCWIQMEAYITKHSEADFSHGICPECMKKLYPEDYAAICPDE